MSTVVPIVDLVEVGTKFEVGDIQYEVVALFSSENVRIAVVEYQAYPKQREPSQTRFPVLIIEELLELREKTEDLEFKLNDEKELGEALLGDFTSTLSELEKTKQWVADCQSGMYVNCVYCGHRYGPEDEVPVAMADMLKEHIEQCPKHPMSALKKALESVWSVRLEDKHGIQFWVARTEEKAYLIVEELLQNRYSRTMDPTDFKAVRAAIDNKEHKRALGLWERAYGDRFGDFIRVQKEEVV